MQGEIITIGDEIISGRVRDVNSFFLSARVSSYGLRITSFSSVGDDPERIKEALSRAVERSDFVLVSGGLGPTADDITARAAADFFDRPLAVNPTMLDSIEQSLHERGLPRLESYLKMAQMPEGADLIDPEGRACGFFLRCREAPVFFLPGVPDEVRRMAEENVLPFLLQILHKRQEIRQRVIKLFGPQEARVGEALAGIEGGFEGVGVGFYPNFPEVHVTLTVRDDDGDRAEETLARVEGEVDSRLGRYIVAKDDETLEARVAGGLNRRGLTVAAAESCSGGLISRRLTSVSGSSGYFERGFVAYSNRAKTELLGVPGRVFEEHGAVSEECVRAMALGARERAGVDAAVASTGIAGPTGGTPDKPVGTVWLGLAAAEGVRTRRFRFHGDRDQNTILTAHMALAWLNRYLTDDTFISGA